MGETAGDCVWTGGHTDTRAIDKRSDPANANTLHANAEAEMRLSLILRPLPRYLTSYLLIYDSPANISSLPRG